FALGAMRSASATGARRSPMNTASAAACERCTALIGESDTSAAASAGASLRPSPTMRTLRPSRLTDTIAKPLSPSVMDLLPFGIAIVNRHVEVIGCGTFPAGPSSRIDRDQIGDSCSGVIEMPSLNGVLETALYVDDMPRARQFYEKVLDLT